MVGKIFHQGPRKPNNAARASRHSHNLCVVIQSVHELGIEADFSQVEAA